MSPKIHIPCGIVSGIAAYAITKSLPFSLSCCLANFIFDIDHCLEYAVFCMQHKEKPTIKRFFSGDYFAEKGTIAVIFHGYEYMLLFLITCLLSFKSGSPMVWIYAGILTGYTEHMVLDLIGNDCSIKGYCLVYRFMVKFNLYIICCKIRKKHRKNNLC